MNNTNNSNISFDSISKKRDTTFDIMKCFGIIAVIIGHLSSIGHQFIFSWHMPLFFIISGYFFREKDVKSMINNDAKRLLLPYSATCLIIVAYYLFLSIQSGHNQVNYWIYASLFANGSSNHTSLYLAHFPQIGAIWFLWALFWCKNAFNYIIQKTKTFYFSICLIVSIIAILIDKYIINLPFAILPGMAAIIFYAIGYIIRQKGGFMALPKIISVLILVAWILAFTFSDMSLVRCYFQNYPLNIIGACGGTYFIWLLSRCISKLQTFIVSFFVWIGRNSLTFLCIHLLDLDIYVRSSILHIPSSMWIPYVILLCIFGTYLFSKIPITKNVFNIV